MERWGEREVVVGEDELGGVCGGWRKRTGRACRGSIGVGGGGSGSGLGTAAAACHPLCLVLDFKVEGLFSPTLNVGGGGTPHFLTG